MKRITTLPRTASRSSRGLLAAALVLGLLLSLLPAGQLAAQPAEMAAQTEEVDASLEHLDLNDDGQITDIDVMYITTAWESRRIQGDVCSGPSPADVNGDGCLDIADIQTVAGNIGVAIVALAARNEAQQALAAGDPTFVVTTTSDAPDNNPGDGVCPVSYTHLTLPTICSV